MCYIFALYGHGILALWKRCFFCNFCINFRCNFLSPSDDSENKESWKFHFSKVEIIRIAALFLFFGKFIEKIFLYSLINTIFQFANLKKLTLLTPVSSTMKTPMHSIWIHLVSLVKIILSIVYLLYTNLYPETDKKVITLSDEEQTFILRLNMALVLNQVIRIQYRFSVKQFARNR